MRKLFPFVFIVCVFTKDARESADYEEMLYDLLRDLSVVFSKLPSSVSEDSSQRELESLEAMQIAYEAHETVLNAIGNLPQSEHFTRNLEEFGFISKAVSGAAKRAKKVAADLKRKVEAAKKAAEKAAADVKKKFEEAKRKAAELKNKAEAAVEAEAKRVVDQAKKAAKAVSKSMDSMTDELGEGLKKSLELIKDPKKLFDIGKKWIAQQVRNSMETVIKPAVAKLAEMISGPLINAIKKAFRFLEGSTLAEGKGLIISDLIEPFRDNIGALITDPFKSNIIDPVVHALGVSDELEDYLQENVMRRNLEALDIMGFVKKIFPPSILETFLGKVKKQFGEVQKFIIEWIDFLRKFIQDVSDAFMPQIQRLLGTLWGGFQSTMLFLAAPMQLVPVLQPMLLTAKPMVLIMAQEKIAGILNTFIAMFLSTPLRVINSIAKLGLPDEALDLRAKFNIESNPMCMSTAEVVCGSLTSSKKEIICDMKKEVMLDGIWVNGGKNNVIEVGFSTKGQAAGDFCFDGQQFDPASKSIALYSKRTTKPPAKPAIGKGTDFEFVEEKVCKFMKVKLAPDAVLTSGEIKVTARTCKGYAPGKEKEEKEVLEEKLLGKACVTDAECDAKHEMTCIAKKCSRLLEDGQPCEEDAECVHDCGKEKKCKVLGTLENMQRMAERAKDPKYVISKLGKDKVVPMITTFIAVFVTPYITKILSSLGTYMYEHLNFIIEGVGIFSGDEFSGMIDPFKSYIIEPIKTVFSFAIAKVICDGIASLIKSKLHISAEDEEKYSHRYLEADSAAMLLKAGDCCTIGQACDSCPMGHSENYKDCTGQGDNMCNLSTTVAPQSSNSSSLKDALKQAAKLGVSAMSFIEKITKFMSDIITGLLKKASDYMYELVRGALNWLTNNLKDMLISLAGPAAAIVTILFKVLAPVLIGAATALCVGKLGDKIKEFFYKNVINVLKKTPAIDDSKAKEVFPKSLLGFDYDDPNKDFVKQMQDKAEKHAKSAEEVYRRHLEGLPVDPLYVETDEQDYRELSEIPEYQEVQVTHFMSI